MYELKQGSARLVYALYRQKEDPATIVQISKALNYNPDQLTQDIQALKDAYDMSGIDQIITPEERERLRWLWDHETNEDETQEWREELSESEAALVEEWDNSLSKGLGRMAADTLSRRQQIPPIVSGMSAAEKVEFRNWLRDCVGMDYDHMDSKELTRAAAHWYDEQAPENQA